MRIEKLIKSFERSYDEYLEDESKMKGTAASISFPETKEEVSSIIQSLSVSRIPITVQGGKTGICGGAVPNTGHIMNLRNMSNIIQYQEKNGSHYVTVQPGITIEELNKQLYKRNLFWPPEPTETSATVGGVIATKAQGIHKCLYGETNDYIEEISYVDHHGQIFTLKRGERKFNRNQCMLPNGNVITLDTNTMGIKENHDLIDIFIGSEGMFGVIVEATLEVLNRPKEIWGIVFFFQLASDIYHFIENMKNTDHQVGTASLAAIEYMDKTALKHVHELKQVATKLKDLPDVSGETVGIVYLEIFGDLEADIEKIAEKLMELAVESVSDPDTAWAVSGEIEIEKTRALRHAVPESINVAVERARLKDNRITKLGTDIAFKEKSFEELVNCYQTDADEAALDIVVFGHISDNHLHVNIVPKSYEDYCKGRRLIEKWSAQAAANRCKIFTEHGVGKLKKELYQRITSKAILNELKHLKKQMDPIGIWNPGNMFDQ
ncbi:FAD-binding oxidoreductase [Geosporobacter ferrireducens]|uniref:D-lactate dehydrogenase (cytochrome) n=1 Tax=Geosporobacter ferrireducens TaxID=1424294 RepID=A0A1D8GDB9_9FIRM|nr:FAD-binding oxidoreductase [Geosporobacter ferrireducens]AOT68897.1 hypothetical protein Gferi_04590 [Geosporobacter ferrireducens]